MDPSVAKDILVFIDIMLVAGIIGYTAKILKEAKRGRFDGWQ